MNKYIYTILIFAVCITMIIFFSYSFRSFIYNDNSNHNIYEQEYFISFVNKNNSPISNQFIQSAIYHQVFYDYKIIINFVNIVKNNDSWYGTLTDTSNVLYKCKINISNIGNTNSKYVNVSFKSVHNADKYQQGYFDACKDFYNGKLKAEPIKDNNNNLSFKWIK